MKIFDFDWQNPDALKLCGKMWLPESSPKAVIALVHGFAEHIGRYGHVAKFFTDRNYILIAFDQQGHGFSEGKRGHTPMPKSLEAVREFLALATEKFNGLPLFLYGHSMGGGIVGHFLVKNQPTYLKGAILTSPWLALAFTPSAIKMWLATLAVKVYPRFTEKSNLDVQELSTDPQVGKDYRADKLIHNDITAQTFVSITKAGLYTIENAAAITLPIYQCTSIRLQVFV